MRLSSGAPTRLLVVAPHPDDEVIGAWGLMRAAKLAGATVRVVVASDGAASHPASRAWPPQRRVRQRRRETLWALRTIGVTAAYVRFLELPDGRLDACCEALRLAFMRELNRPDAPDLVVGPTIDDDHPDHRAVALALTAVAPRRMRRLDYGVWAAHATPARTACWTAPITAPWAAKRFALRLHRSQAGLIADDPGGFVFTPAQEAAFTRPLETFHRPGVSR